MKNKEYVGSFGEDIWKLIWSVRPKKKIKEFDDIELHEHHLTAILISIQVISRPSIPCYIPCLTL